MSSISVAVSLPAGIAEIQAAGRTGPRIGRDPVNQPMIHNWIEAIGDRNPIYADEAAARTAGHPGIVAPPAMIQVWTMPSLNATRSADDPMVKLLELFDSAGYVGVVATNCEQTYHRYLRPWRNGHDQLRTWRGDSDPNRPRWGPDGSSTNTPPGESATKSSPNKIGAS